MTMSRGAIEVQKRLKDGTISVTQPGEMFLDLADAISASMGGTSGILFELALRKTAAVVLESQSEGQKVVDATALKQAFVAGVDIIKYCGGAEEGYRTMIDALLPASRTAAVEGGGGIADIAKSARDGAEATRSMVAKAGRANYVPFQKMEGVPDPGAVAVAIILERIAESWR
jgi:dihydroxyacetone kinase